MKRKRTRRTREEWAALLAEQAARGVSSSQFARERVIPLASLLNWKKKLAAKSGPNAEASTPQPAFSEVTVVPRARTTGARVEVVTRRGVAIRLDGAFDGALLREVLRAVESC